MYFSVRDGKMVGLGKRSKQVGLTPKTFLYVVDTLNNKIILLQLILQFGWLQFCYNHLTRSLDWNLMNHNPSHIFHIDLNQMNHNPSLLSQSRWIGIATSSFYICCLCVHVLVCRCFVKKEVRF